jgi:hypothetical protein
MVVSWLPILAERRAPWSGFRTPDIVRKSLRVKGGFWPRTAGRGRCRGNGLGSGEVLTQLADGVRDQGDGSSSRSPFSPLIRPKTPHGFISHQSRGTSPENMNLLDNEPTRRPGQPLCQDPWGSEFRCQVPGARSGTGAFPPVLPLVLPPAPPVTAEPLPTV